MESSLDRTATDTLTGLEARLRRIEYVLSGHDNSYYLKDDKRSANMRLRDLERGLDQLVVKSRVMQDLLKLYAYHPDFFSAAEPSDASSTLEIPYKRSIVLAAASSFHQTASRLTSIKDTPPPEAEISSQLIHTAVRAADVELLQDSQVREIAALKERSAALLQRVYSVDIIQAGECWADLEGRVEIVEQATRRAVSTRQQEGKII